MYFSKKLTIPSTIVHMECLDPFIDSICSLHNIQYKKSLRIKILLNEAVSNAMRHGNSYSPEKYVTIEFQPQEAFNQFCFIVSDEGAGFPHGELPDPRNPDRLQIEGGRGVFLMRELCEDLQYENNGSRMRINFCV